MGDESVVPGSGEQSAILIFNRHIVEESDVGGVVTNLDKLKTLAGVQVHSIDGFDLVACTRFRGH